MISLAVILALVGTGGALGWNQFQDASAASEGTPFFAGYVDVTATPSYSFESAATLTGKSVVLSFIVSNPDEPCEPSWGGVYGLDDAQTTLDLDRRIARFVQNSGDVSVSFGGQANSELATECTDADDLKSAYEAVINRYHLTSIDLDIEGDSLADTEAGLRRATAIASIQADRKAADKALNVWLTLPVSTTGLTSVGITAVDQFLAANVNLAGVNAMTMDFGDTLGSSGSVLEAATAAAEATHAQLDNSYEKHGTPLGPQTLWSKIGLTPMIGQSDIVGESFGLDDAVGLNAFALDKGVGRMSMWSLNRDAGCGTNYPDVTRVSDNCSGVVQGDSTFAQILAQGLTGQIDAVVTSATATPRVSSTPVPDDPKTSPYPIWSKDATYVDGDRTVWYGNVYAAKWWTSGDQPDTPFSDDSSAPWELIGPVLPGDKPIPVTVVPDGTYPDWVATTIYEKGDRVLFGGRILETKWWNQGESPQAALDGSSTAAWVLLAEDEVKQILAKAEADSSAVPTAEPVAG
ncbi:glycosyl hydrolase family 18 [Cryobacterium sp. PH29-G1]|uniref:chitinase n=1 Tax=Cryobacterium sp. PH29-G1 TaxID=3046211 RepID=UPI0024BA3B53|nr:glycosyl hydrolase family 18 [Cryobacterium sp. PH29-G1]MDJ0350738.1 glycosyl hydrolase family 18 [Cryobacterium sp. PH29-G1]